jgi:hypothetical protein
MGTPNTGLSHRSTQLSHRGEHILENVTQRCNHQQALDKKGFRVVFIHGEVLMWPKGQTTEDEIVIGTEEGGLYKLKGHSKAALTHSIENPCEIWHRRLAHINYKALPYVRKAVIGLPEFKVDHECVCTRKEHQEPFPKDRQ